ncbi:MAG: YdcF family protein [Magnetospirillum sp. WYHS-4]
MAGPVPRRLRSRRAFGRMAVFALVAGGLWTWGLVWFAGLIPGVATDDLQPTDAIVVLTGGSGRLDVGIDLLAEERAKKLFISGVFPGTEVRQLLRTFQRNPHYLEFRVDVGTAVNTHENATETADWMREQGYTSLRLVTGNYHMPRSLLEFGAALPDAVIVPHPVFPEHVKRDWWAWPGTAGLVLREYTKYMLVLARIAVLDTVIPPRKT